MSRNSERYREKQGDNIRWWVSGCLFVLLGVLVGLSLNLMGVGATSIAERYANDDSPPVVSMVPSGTPRGQVVRATRIPCWAPPAQVTCTPTALPADTATSTPTSVPPDTPTPTLTAVPTESATSVPTSTATNTATSGPTNTASPSPTLTGTATPNYHNPPPDVLAEEETMRQLINQHRIGVGLHTFLHIVSLDLAERNWAVQMIVTNQCFHGDFGQRAAQEGYTGFAWGEAGSCGYPNAGAALQGWLDSPAHRGIVEAVTMTEYGVGAWRYPNGNWQFWLLVGCNEQIPCLGSLEMQQSERTSYTQPPPLAAPGYEVAPNRRE